MSEYLPSQLVALTDLCSMVQPMILHEVISPLQECCFYFQDCFKIENIRGQTFLEEWCESSHGSSAGHNVVICTLLCVLNSLLSLMRRVLSQIGGENK